MADLVLTVLLLAALGGAWWLLRGLRAVPGGQAPVGALSLSVVIPARDEERTLPSLLGSLGRLADGMPETIVVDDGSRDATAAVARSAGATIVNPGEPPFGWTGKAWACDRGARSTNGELLLFLDADT
jgi:4,4'-diaponeurosporenoate glycosyltransferase